MKLGLGCHSDLSPKPSWASLKPIPITKMGPIPQLKPKPTLHLLRSPFSLQATTTEEPEVRGLAGALETGPSYPPCRALSPASKTSSCGDLVTAWDPLPQPLHAREGLPPPAATPPDSSMTQARSKVRLARASRMPFGAYIKRLSVLSQSDSGPLTVGGHGSGGDA